MPLAERFILSETWTTVEHLVLIGVRVILARTPFSCAGTMGRVPRFRKPPRHRDFAPSTAPRDAPKDDVASGVHRPRDAKKTTPTDKWRLFAHSRGSASNRVAVFRTHRAFRRTHAALAPVERRFLAHSRSSASNRLAAFRAFPNEWRFLKHLFVENES